MVRVNLFDLLYINKKFAMSDELERLVRKDCVLNWESFKEKWFCKTSSCKIPGLLKIGKENVLYVE